MVSLTQFSHLYSTENSEMSWDSEMIDIEYPALLPSTLEVLIIN